MLRSIGPISRTFGTRYIHTTSSSYFKDYYEILGVPRSASAKVIKAAYYDKAKIHHPDANKASSGSLKFQEISEAYEILGDTAKRRAYDTTTGLNTTYGQHIPRNQQTRAENTSAYRTTSSEPINMNHIQYVYRTLNKEEPEEPKFRPFEDHHFPGTHFNRFEYARRWDPDGRAWVYNKRADAKEYHKKIQKGQRILHLCISVITMGVLFHIFNYNIFMKRMSNQSSKQSDDIAHDKAGMYIIQHQDQP